MRIKNRIISFLAGLFAVFVLLSIVVFNNSGATKAKETCPVSINSPGGIGYHDFGTQYGVEVQLNGEKLYDTDMPSIAQNYADFIAMNGVDGKECLVGYTAETPQYGVNYTNSNNTLVFFFGTETFNLSEPRKFYIRKGFPLQNGAAVQEDWVFTLENGVWSSSAPENSVIFAGKQDGGEGIDVSEENCSVAFRFKSSLGYDASGDITEKVQDFIKVNGTLLSEIQGANVMYDGASDVMVVSVASGAVNGLDVYRTNDVYFSKDMPVSASRVLGRAQYCRYSCLNGAWECHDAGAVTAEAVNDIAGSGQAILEHSSGLYEFDLSFSEGIRDPKGFETFIQNEYMEYLFIDGQNGADFSDAIQIHYNSDNRTMYVYLLTDRINLSPQEDHEVILDAGFPVGKGVVLGENIKFSYSKDSGEWVKSSTVAHARKDFGISVIESKTGILASEEGSAVQILFTQPLGLTDGDVSAEAMNHIRINGYYMSSITGNGGEKCRVTYRAAKNILELFVPNDCAAKVSENKRNVIIFDKTLFEDALELATAVRFDFYDGVWTKGIVSGLEDLSVSVFASEAGSTPLSDFGYYWGLGIKFSTAIRTNPPTVAGLEMFVQKDYLDYISVNGSKLSEISGKVEMHYNVADDLLIIYFPKSAVTGEQITLSLDKDFPISFESNGDVSSKMNKELNFASANNSRFWREIYLYEREFEHNFKTDGTNGWNYGEETVLTPTDAGYALNGLILRGERAGNFEYNVSVKPGAGVLKIIFRTSESGYGGYEAVVDNGSVQLLRRRPFELLASAPQFLAENSFVSTGDVVNVRILTQDYNIYIYVNDSAAPIISVKDLAYVSGFYALDGENCEVLSASAKIDHFYTAQMVAQSMIVPEQPVNGLRIQMPMVPSGFVVKVYSSAMENVDRNGIISLRDSAVSGEITFIVTNRLDGSFALVSKTVTIPACTVDESAPADAAYISEKAQELAAFTADATAQNVSALLKFAENLDRWKFAPEDREEFDKTIGIAISILQKAQEKINGTYLTDQFDFTGALQPADELMRQGLDILSQILNGQMPFKGLFAENGANTVDFALYFEEESETYHLYYIRGTAAYMWAERPTHYFGHAISKDLQDWTVVQPVLETSVDGDDDAHVWAPQVVKINGTYYMFYTAVSSRITQTIKVAQSDDLYNWHRVTSIPALHAPAEWGIWDADKWSDNRDPGVLVDEEAGRIYLYYTTQAKNVGYVLGIMSCDINDLTDWKDEGYQILPQGTATPPESVFPLKKDGKYHIFHTDYALGVAHLISDSPIGPWKRSEGMDGGKATAGAASEIVYNSKTDKWYYAYIQHHAYSSLHFAKFYEMLWMPDDSVVMKEIAEDYDLKMGEPEPGVGIYTFPEDQPGAEGARAFWVQFDEILRDPVGQVSGGYELWIQQYFEEFIEINGILMKDINELSKDQASDYIQINYNISQLRLEVLILKNEFTDTLAFEASSDNVLTFKAGMPIGKGKVLENDVRFEYSALTKQWTRVS